MTLSGPWLAGVDGCRSGWIAAFVRPTGQKVQTRLFAHFADILSAVEAPAIIAVDAPIGLPDHSYGGRRADNIVRQLLLARKSSVFPVPSRSAVFADQGRYMDSESRRRAHQRICTVAAATSTPPRRISIFTFGILEKIRDVDVVLRDHSSARKRVHETHPEFEFQQLNGEKAVAEAKKSEAGLHLRTRLLMRGGLSPEAVNGPAPKGAKPDDLLDALACALVARRIYANEAHPFPDPPDRDGFDLPMAIWR